MTRKSSLNKQTSFRMCSGSRTRLSQNRQWAWQAEQAWRSSFYSQRNWVIKWPERESQGQAFSNGRRSNTEDSSPKLQTPKWVCCRDRKDGWDKSGEHLPSAFQTGSGNTVQRAFQLHGCRQGWHSECTGKLINWEERSSINSLLRLRASREDSLEFANLWSRLAINKTQAPRPEMLRCAS